MEQELGLEPLDLRKRSWDLSHRIWERGAGTEVGTGAEDLKQGLARLQPVHLINLKLAMLKLDP
jgi:hypothetical protein